jgi:hypothetical protein
MISTSNAGSNWARHVLISDTECQQSERLSCSQPQNAERGDRSHRSLGPPRIVEGDSLNFTPRIVARVPASKEHSTPVESIRILPPTLCCLAM